jgi:hypothetical protein
MAVVRRPGSGSGGAVPWLGYLIAALVVVAGALLWKSCSDTLASHQRMIVSDLRVPAPQFPKLPRPPRMPMPR